MYNNGMNDDENHPLNWSPYDWLIQIEDRMKELQNKHNVILQNQKEMALAYNTQLRKVNDLQRKVDTLESILWKNDSEQAIQDYWRLTGRPKR
tara:strand:- start:237 stop:515 length:279 start_codon:yes stop_codon:yes gene_type:complete